MQIKSNAVDVFTSASDQRTKEGFFVASTGVIVANATGKPYGLILDGGNTDDSTTVAIVEGGYMGTASVKLAASAGTVVKGTLLVLSSATLGTAKAQTPVAGEVVVAVALEAGANDELIEAAILRPYIIGPDTIDDASITVGKLADDAVETAKIKDLNVTEGKLADDAITGAKLANAVSDQIRSTTVVVANTPVTPDGVAHITGQVKDSEGNSLTGTFLIQIWFAATALAAPADLGTLTALTNSLLLKEHTDDAYGVIRTHTDGSWGAELDLAADGDVHAMAVINGLVATDSEAITGN